jgi:hypothetical protein
VPSSESLYWKDYSFNRTQFNLADSGLAEQNIAAHKPFIVKNPKIDQEPWPIWPPDMFGLTSLLLEQTAVYQRIKPSQVPLEFPVDEAILNAAFFPWRLKKGEIVSSDSQFRMQGAHQVVLRLVGALWASGALTISGLIEVDAKSKNPKILSKSEMQKEIRGRGLEAIELMKRRNKLEISDSEIDRFTGFIYKSYFDFGDMKSEFQKSQIAKPVLKSAELCLEQLKESFSDCGTTETDRANHFENIKPTRLPIVLVVWATQFLQHYWDVIRKSKESIAPKRASYNEPRLTSPWEIALVNLHIMADEAGKGMGFSWKKTGRSTHVKDQQPEQVGLLLAGQTCKFMWDSFTISRRKLGRDNWAPRTLTRCFNDSLGSVLPKARTPGNGCTIRSLSHNLCLLPPKTRIRARWARQQTSNSSSTFNVLLVPYPFQIKSKHVVPNEISRNDDDDWGYFSVKPIWLYEDSDEKSGRDDFPTDPAEFDRYHNLFWAFLRSMLKDQADGVIDAVVLPEGALDWRTFDFVQKKILTEFPSIQVFISGVTEAPKDRLAHFSAGKTSEDEATGTAEGNFVATYMRASESDTWGLEHVRPKHHRWRLDKNQLQNYALSQRLSPTKFWWEDIDLPPREMLFAEFSAGSVLTTLICEDLARIDPCQIALRSVGPNLIFVILMDAAQVVARWPYQYAGVLSDDPGSSVLTLTSFGLLRRSSLSEGHKSRSIAIWREPQSSTPKLIELAQGYHGQLLSLRKEYVLERTLDGRGDNGDSAVVWRFAGLTPVKSYESPPGGGADGDADYPIALKRDIGANKAEEKSSSDHVPIVTTVNTS